MSLIHRSKYITFIMMLAIAIMQFEVSAHNKTHLFDTDDCAKCQILTQSQNLQTPDNSIIYPGTSRLTSFLKFRNSAWKNNSLLRFSCQNF